MVFVVIIMLDIFQLYKVYEVVVLLESVSSDARSVECVALERSLRNTCLQQSVVIFYKIIYIMFLYINKRNKE